MGRMALAFVSALLAVLLAPSSASAEATPTTCWQELQRVGTAFNTTEANAELEKADCDQRSVLCVDATGYPLPSESTDPKVKSGETLIVKLFGPKGCSGVLTVRTDVSQSDITLFPPMPTQAAAREGAAPPPLPPVEIQQLARAVASTTSTTESITVSISRTDASRLTLEGLTLLVTPPRYCTFCS